MTGRIDARLQALGITLPEPPAAVAAYVPFVAIGNLIFISGQLPIAEGAVLYAGRLGSGVSIEAGYQAARQAGLNVLAQARAACDGDLDRVTRIVKLGGFVACTAEFTDHPKVINGASDLMLDVFGETGRHARFAVGAPSLPLGVAVEIEAIVAIA